MRTSPLRPVLRYDTGGRGLVWQGTSNTLRRSSNAVFLKLINEHRRIYGYVFGEANSFEAGRERGWGQLWVWENAASSLSGVMGESGAFLALKSDIG